MAGFRVLRRSPSLRFGEATGFAALAGVRLARFSTSEPPLSPEYRPILDVGAGLTIPFEWLLLIPALELGAAMPGTSNARWMLVPAATLTVAFHHDTGPVWSVPWSGLHREVGIGLLAGLHLHPLRERAPPTPGAQLGFWLDAGVDAEDWFGGIRALVGTAQTTGGMEGLSGFGLLALVGRQLGAIGERGALRALALAGPMFVEHGSGRPGLPSCSPGPTPLAEGELQVVWYSGSLRLRGGATVFGGPQTGAAPSRMLGAGLGRGARPD